jgi:hypothetical protein
MYRDSIFRVVLVLRVQRRFKNIKERIYLLYSHVNIYKLNTEKTTTLRGGRLLAIGDRRVYQQTRFLDNASIVLLFKNQANKETSVLSKTTKTWEQVYFNEN